MNQVGDVTPPAKGGSGTGWQFAVFRAWREREHPQSSYEIAPRVWRPEWQGQAQGVRDRTRQALKNWEPRLTGMAYSDRIVHLVMLARKVAPSVLDLARRRRIRVVVLSSGGDEGGRNAADRKALEVAAPTEHADE